MIVSLTFLLNADLHGHSLYNLHIEANDQENNIFLVNSWDEKISALRVILSLPVRITRSSRSSSAVSKEQTSQRKTSRTHCCLETAERKASLSQLQEFRKKNNGPAPHNLSETTVQ
jgi:hypothetical protein